MSKTAWLAAFLLSGIFCARSVMAGSIPVEYPSSDFPDKDIIDQNLAQIPQYRLTGMLGIQIFDSTDFVSYQWDGRYLKIAVPPKQASSTRNASAAWGEIIREGIASKDLYRMYYDHPDWRDQYLAWIQATTPEADLFHFYLSYNFRSDHELWYTTFPPLSLEGADFAAQLQRDLFQGALQSRNSASLYTTVDDDQVLLQTNQVTFQKRGDRLIVGDYTLMLTNENVITEIMKGDHVIMGGLAIPLAEPTLKLIEENNCDVLNPQPFPFLADHVSGIFDDQQSHSEWVDGWFDLSEFKSLRVTFTPESIGHHFFLRLDPDEDVRGDPSLWFNRKIYTVPPSGVLDIPVEDFSGPESDLVGAPIRPDDLRSITRMTVYSGESALGNYSLDQDRSAQVDFTSIKGIPRDSETIPVAPTRLHRVPRATDGPSGAPLMPLPSRATSGARFISPQNPAHYVPLESPDGRARLRNWQLSPHDVRMETLPKK